MLVASTTDQGVHIGRVGSLATQIRVLHTAPHDASLATSSVTRSYTMPKLCSSRHLSVASSSMLHNGAVHLDGEVSWLTHLPLLSVGPPSPDAEANKAVWYPTVGDGAAGQRMDHVLYWSILCVKSISWASLTLMHTASIVHENHTSLEGLHLPCWWVAGFLPRWKYVS